MSVDLLQVGADKVEHPDKVVEVSISTTAGFYPAEGDIRILVDEKVEVVLEKAMLVLEIKSTEGWVAQVDSPSGRREIDPGKTYTENSLTGKVEFDWGPKEGGGG